MEDGCHCEISPCPSPPGKIDQFLGIRYATNCMKKIIQARIYKGEKYYVADCVDLPVVTQGRTLDELAENLRQAIALHLDGEDLSDFDLAPDPSVLVSFELEPFHAQA